MPDGEETVIIVVQTGDEIVGLIVDRVSEVTDIPSEEIVDAPSFGADVNTEYILGVGKSEERVRLLLDIDQVLDTIVVDEPELNSSS